MSSQFTESDEFRLHIRNLLYEYSISHYTTNFVTFTEDLVLEFVEGLQPISLTDRYSVTLVADPFDTFSQIHSLSTLSAYDEIPQTTSDARLYLKKIMGVTRGPPRTDKIAHNDTYGPSCAQEPFLPALTRIARQNTPKLGKKEKTAIPGSFTHLLASQNIKAVPVESVPDQILVPGDILQLKCQIKPQELASVKSLLQGTADMMRPQKSYKNRYLDPAFLSHVPFSEPSRPDEPFMPIFPKERLPRSGMTSTMGFLDNFDSLADISSIVVKKIEVDELEVDISIQNLVTVDGWETIKSSPPSTPISKSADNEDELDQLLLASSPNTGSPLVEELLQAKIETVLMPRCRQIGGSSGIPPHILAGKSLGSFLQPLLSPITLVSVPKKCKEGIQRPCWSPTPSSLVGQPPSELESQIVHKNSWTTEPTTEWDFDAELKTLYTGHDLEDMIMKEAIDNKQNMMMEVPTLPEPNVHAPNAMHIPKTFVDFLVPQGADNKDEKIGSTKKSSHLLHQFLKRPKGRSSLALALSWVPFTTDKQLPSLLELIKVDEISEEKQQNDGSDLAKAEALLELLDIGDKDNSERRYSWSDDICDHYPPRLPDDFPILQTREERWRLAKLEGRLEDGMDIDEDEDQQKQNIHQSDIGVYDSDERLEDERPAKRSRLEDAAYTDEQWPDKDPPLTVSETLDVTKAGFETLSPSRGDYNSGSPAFLFSDDKENWPPITSSLSKSLDEDSSDYHTPEHMRHYKTVSVSQYEPEDAGACAMEDEDSFQLLSFGSRQPVLDAESFDAHAEVAFYDHDPPKKIVKEPMGPAEISELVADTCLQQDCLDYQPDFGLVFEPDIASRSLGISAFAQLRAKRVSGTKVAAVPAPTLKLPPVTSTSQGPQVAPQEILDQNTIRLPQIIGVATSVHRYMASIELIQKHALVRALRSEECAVELAERQSLDGVDLVLDPHCAIIFLSLFTLSARCDTDVERVSQQSWKFSCLLIIFEAYPEHRSKRSNTKQGRHSSATASELCAYTPPIIKAIKKFRRDLNIADACGTKCPDTKIEYGFSDTVNEAALLTRFYGDQVEARDETEGALWGEREWLAADFVEDEEARLAGINGLNQFSASIILCQVTLQEFVDMSAQERVDAFAPYVGVDAMMICNTDLDARFQAIYSTTTESELDSNEY